MTMPLSRTPSLIEASRLPRMTFVSECLEVLALVGSASRLRNDVINVGRWSPASTRTERLLAENLGADPEPVACVATCTRPSTSRVVRGLLLLLMLGAEPLVGQSRTAAAI